MMVIWRDSWELPLSGLEASKVNRLNDYRSALSRWRSDDCDGCWRRESRLIGGYEMVYQYSAFECLLIASSWFRRDFS